MKKLLFASLLLTTALSGCQQREDDERVGQSPTLVSADSGNCYDVKLHFNAPTQSRALFVVLDQTAPFDEDLSRSVESAIHPLLVPGTHVAIYTFSALTSDHHAKQVFEADIQQPVPDKDRSSLSVPRLKKLDRCLRTQEQSVRDGTDNAITSAFDDSPSDFANSEILKSLGQVSKAVRGASQPEKFVLVASDMIEHSKNVDFYAKGRLRNIVAAKELQQADNLNLTADFGGASIAVIGTGLISSDAKRTEIRDERSLNSLRAFWSDWFEASNSRIIAYGEPEILEKLSWPGSKNAEIR